MEMTHITKTAWFTNEKGAQPCMIKSSAKHVDGTIAALVWAPTCASRVIEMPFEKLHATRCDALRASYLNKTVRYKNGEYIAEDIYETDNGIVFRLYADRFNKDAYETAPLCDIAFA